MSAITQDVSIAQLYEQIKRIREFEQKAIDLFADGSVPGFTHSCMGQEAAEVGVCSVLRPADRVASNHRGHGHLIAKGADTKRMMAEILGRAEGYCQGMGGELHILDSSVGLIGANGIVGAGVPIAAGAALADQMAGSDNVTVVFFGEGATSEGYWHEAMNMAGIWKLPLVLVCENNRYSEFTRSEDTVAGRIVDRAAGYGFPGVEVDGQDVLAVADVTREAVDRARRGDGPTLIEIHTYRWFGHFYGEEALIGDYEYRSKDEVADWKANRDPVQLTRATAIAQGCTDDELEAIDRRVDEEIAAAATFALQGTHPEPDQALEHVLSIKVVDPTERTQA